MKNDDEIPGPLLFILGFLQLAFGLVIGITGFVLRVFPITSALGNPLVIAGQKSTFNGGANFTNGLIKTLGLIARGINALATKLFKLGQNAKSQKKLPPVE